MPQLPTDSMNQKLVRYRETQRLSLREMAELMRVSSASTIKAWEDGAEIPGPATLLLELLIDGKMPFTGLNVQPRVREAMWELQMNLGAFERLDQLRLAGGFATVTDYIAAIVQEDMAKDQAGRSARAPVGELAMVAEAATPYVTGSAGAGDVSAPLRAGAAAFVKSHPLPAVDAPPHSAAGRGPRGKSAATRAGTPVKNR